MVIRILKTVKTQKHFDGLVCLLWSFWTGQIWAAV